MGEIELRTRNGIAYREALPHDSARQGDPVLLLHGYPESSYMWRHLIPVIAGAGRRAIAPDLPGYGDSPADPPGTWERHVEAVERFRRSLGLERVALAVHDWGGLIGLRWACDHPEAVSALVLADTGFFPDGEWHGLAEALRAEGTGEELVDGMTQENFAAMLAGVAPGIDAAAAAEYFKAFGDEARRRGQLELYRSGDFAKLEPYQDRLAALDVPVLVVWGEDDAFAPVAGAHRFRKLMGDARVEVIEGAGHFVFEDAPERCAAAVAAFLPAG